MIYARWIFGEDELAPAREVRTRVFVEEQGYTPEDEYDDMDAISWHVLVSVDEKVVATGRVFLSEGKYKVGRICVLEEYRGQGLGDMVVRMLLDRALQAGASGLHISAQSYVVGMYERFGFRRVGEPYRLPGDTRDHIDLYAKAEEIVFPKMCEV